MRLRPLLFMLAIGFAVPRLLPNGFPVSGSQARQAEIDRASILQSDPGTKVA